MTNLPRWVSDRAHGNEAPAFDYDDWLGWIVCEIPYDDIDATDYGRERWAVAPEYVWGYADVDPR